jgi:hypothetical protein
MNQLWSQGYEPPVHFHVDIVTVLPNDIKESA